MSGRTFQSKGFVLKTVSDDALAFARDFALAVPGSRVAWARHEPDPPKVPHWHLVALFEDRIWWKSVADKAQELDKCASSDTCKKPRKAVRYLLHLDSPDKHLVPRDALQVDGCWGPSEIEDCLESSSVASTLVDTCITFWRDGLSPLDALSRLVSSGFEPYQISSSLQAYSRLVEFWLKYAPTSSRAEHTRGMGAAPRPHICGTCAPPPNGEQTQVCDIQGKNGETSALVREDNLHECPGSRVEKTETAHGTQCIGVNRVDARFSQPVASEGNLSERIREDVESVFGLMSQTSFFPSNFSVEFASRSDSAVPKLNG